MTKRRFFTLLLTLACASPAPAPASQELELTYLANEGFLLRSGQDAVLIDAFVAEPYAGYTALPPNLLEQMLAPRAPFAGVTVTLASHIHRDHFQVETAVLYLGANPGSLLASSPDVVGSLLDAGPQLQDRVESILPEEGESITRVWGSIRVDFLRLSHGSGEFASLQNLGHFIHIGGWKILHVGDAESGVARFGEYDLAGRDLDVALIPYWYFSSESGRRVLEGDLAARTRIAVHIPAPELDDVRKELGGTHPDVIVFGSQGETLRIPGGMSHGNGKVPESEPGTTMP